MIGIWAFAFACQNESEPHKPDSTLDPSTVDESVVGSGELEESEEALARVRMRMNIEQIQDSMKHITGVDWMDGDTNLWTKYATTLGVPDYQEVITEDLSENVIFQKFLQDAATFSCDEWIEHDGVAGVYPFFMHGYDEYSPESQKDNFLHLRSVVHGYLEPEDPMLESLEQLHRLIYQRTQNDRMAWHTVCVALFTHPDFYTY